VSYEEWLRIEQAEIDLAQSLGRGERVKLPGFDAIWSACRPLSARSAARTFPGQCGTTQERVSVVPHCPGTGHLGRRLNRTRAADVHPGVDGG
jgi:hypothetical protein